MEITRINEFNDQLFQQAFKKYFIELGADLNDDDFIDIFNQMNQQEGNFAYCLIHNNQCIGFIMGREEQFEHWFLTQDFGFIREFWIHPKHRQYGLGKKLLFKIEQEFKEAGNKKVLLTSDTAIPYYEKLGYQVDVSISALNQDPVLFKNLT